MGDGFEAKVSTVGEDVLVSMTGTVNRLAKEGLDAAYEEASSQPGRVLLDFGAVDYINSTGIAVIVGVLARARAEEREVVAFGLTDHYREVFQITRLADFMTIYDDQNAAVAAG
ncbi:MAG TPA: STAS domain-containing protein [Acidimicrobiia bacterium]|nr:STAS domain-containing protein [Acidimicrobiia bacterium]